MIVELGKTEDGKERLAKLARRWGLQARDSNEQGESQPREASSKEALETALPAPPRSNQGDGQSGARVSRTSPPTSGASNPEREDSNNDNWIPPSPADLDEDMEAEADQSPTSGEDQSGALVVDLFEADPEEFAVRGAFDPVSDLVHWILPSI